MTSVTFIYRPSTKLLENQGHLFIRVIHERKIRSVTTPFRLYKNEWDNYRHSIVYEGADPARLRELQSVSHKIKEETKSLLGIIESLELRGPYTALDVLLSYRHQRQKNDFNDFVDNLSVSLISKGQERTARAYRTACKRLVRFNRNDTIRLEQLTTGLLRAFETELRNEGKAANTISFYMRNLRAIYNRAVAGGILEKPHENLFGGLYVGVQITRKRALSKSDLCKLYRFDVLGRYSPAVKEFNFTTRGLLTAQRLFFFSFLSRGMSFVDMAYLRKENISKGILSYFRKKTGQLIEVKITPAMQNLIHCFAEETCNSPFLFPIINNPHKSYRLQYESALRLYNKRLAKLAQMCGIKVKLTSHVARHSWATIAKSENLPLWVISEGLGHHNEKTTYTYLASFERSVLDLANDRISTVVGGLTGCSFLRTE